MVLEVGFFFNTDTQSPPCGRQKLMDLLRPETCGQLAKKPHAIVAILLVGWGRDMGFLVGFQ